MWAKPEWNLTEVKVFKIAHFLCTANFDFNRSFCGLQWFLFFLPPRCRPSKLSTADHSEPTLESREAKGFLGKNLTIICQLALDENPHLLNKESCNCKSVNLLDYYLHYTATALSNNSWSEDIQGQVWMNECLSLHVKSLIHSFALFLTCPGWLRMMWSQRAVQQMQ